MSSWQNSDSCVLQCGLQYSWNSETWNIRWPETFYRELEPNWTMERHSDIMFCALDSGSNGSGFKPWLMSLHLHLILGKTLHSQCFSLTKFHFQPLSGKGSCGDVDWIRQSGKKQVLPPPRYTNGHQWIVGEAWQNAWGSPVIAFHPGGGRVAILLATSYYWNRN